MRTTSVGAVARYYLGDIAAVRRQAPPPRQGERLAFGIPITPQEADVLGAVEALRPFIQLGYAGPELRGTADELEAALAGVAGQG